MFVIYNLLSKSIVSDVMRVNVEYDILVTCPSYPQHEHTGRTFHNFQVYT